MNDPAVELQLRWIPLEVGYVVSWKAGGPRASALPMNRLSTCSCERPALSRAWTRSWYAPGASSLVLRFIPHNPVAPGSMAGDGVFGVRGSSGIPGKDPTRPPALDSANDTPANPAAAVT